MGTGNVRRAATTQAVIDEIEAIGARLARLRGEVAVEMNRLEALDPLARDMQISVAEIAEAAGVSRQTLAARRRSPGEARYDPELRVLLTLGMKGPLRESELSQQILVADLPRQDVRRALKNLEENGLVEVARRETGPKGLLSSWGLSEQGLAALPGRLRRFAVPAGRRWTVYLQVDPAEGQRLIETAVEDHGLYQAALIPKGTVEGMQTAELAFRVEAGDLDQAHLTAEGEWAKLRTKAGLVGAPARIVAYSSPDA